MRMRCISWSMDDSALMSELVRASVSNTAPKTGMPPSGGCASPPRATALRQPAVASARAALPACAAGASEYCS